MWLHIPHSNEVVLVTDSCKSTPIEAVSRILIEGQHETNTLGRHPNMHDCVCGGNWSLCTWKTIRSHIKHSVKIR